MKRDVSPAKEPAKETMTTRLFGIVARDARTAVIFRRGPSKRVRMLLWDLASDELTPGQWLAGRVYDERCGLSPNGKLLVYFAGKFKSEIATFTAISRPPFFTALALWPDRSTWGGGGFFEDDKTVILNYGMRLPELNDYKSVPDDFVVTHLVEYQGRHAGAEVRESNQGWILKAEGVHGPPTAYLRMPFAQPRVHEKPHPLRARLILERTLLGYFEVNGPSTVHNYRLVESGRRGGSRDPVDLGRLDWADWDHDGSLVFGERGRLFRRAVLGPDRSPKLVADLRHQAFVNIPPPAEARLWP
jgi:hypothetical protein